ncbi:MAG: Lpg1974 family pore-forming outer membrane protein [Xanthobacteraceae bacterium]
MSKRFLLTTVSALAVSAFQALPVLPASAADMPPPGMSYKAPAPAVPPDTWTWWVEGGAQGVSGGLPYVPNMTPAFATPRPGWGWDAAGGFDYRFAGPWHILGDFRYGQNRSRTGSSNPLFSTSSVTFVGANSATRREYNWNADFMVGRDIGIGSDAQLDFGVRVAEIHGATSGLAQWNAVTSSGPVHLSDAYQQSSNFLGAGPRVAVQGSIPFASAWSIDYEAGAAGLASQTSLAQTIQASPSFLPLLCTVSCPVAVSSTKTTMVFNTDGTLGLSYAVTPNAKLSIDYHVDAYFDALPVVNSAGNVTNANRIYQGPSLRLTYKY